MLRNLHIENVAVIEKSDIEFMPGFNVLTGETGAGKSIIIDSLLAILGARTSRDLIRHGENKATVSALFTNLPNEAVLFAGELGFDCEDDSILVHREISADGKNSCKINGRAATVSILRSLSEYLVNIHGQNDGLRLLDDSSHIDYLDNFGEYGDLLNEYYNSYRELLTIRKQTKEIIEKNEALLEKADLLRSRQAELLEADVSLGEYESLNQQRKLLANAEKISTSTLSAKLELFGTDDSDGAVAMLTRVCDSLTSIEGCSDSAKALSLRARELLALAQDLQLDIDTFVLGVDFSPQELEIIESRLDLISRLMKKYATDEQGLISLLAETSSELEKLDNMDEIVKKQNEKYAKKRENVQILSQKLHEKRQKAAENLKKSIEKEMRELDMPHARFQINVDSTAENGHIKFTRRGTDSVTFLMTTNPGEDFKPLAKVASGGELSRIMLAIKSVLSKSDYVGTMIFDEIDTGVSGHAANKVGEKLFELSQSRQVLCVTHLPQIAALGEYQYLISKSVANGKTQTDVLLLDKNGRTDEIARMTAGMGITEQTLKNASEILSIAENFQKSVVDKQHS